MWKRFIASSQRTNLRLPDTWQRGYWTPVTCRGQRPYSGHATRKEGVRELVVGSHLLLYRVRDTVELLSVTHGARRRKKA